MNPAIQLTSLIQRKADLLSCQVDNEIVLLDTDIGSYFGMNPVASRIWELLVTPLSVTAICQQLLTEYQIDPANCSKEVMHFLSELANFKIIQVTNE